MTNDDKTPAFGVPTNATEAIIDEASIEDGSDEVDPDLGIPAKDLRLFDAYFHELGVLAAEDPRPNSPEEQAAIDELYAQTLETMSKSPEELRVERRLAGEKARGDVVAVPAVSRTTTSR